jgi:hypothetical protein
MFKRFVKSKCLIGKIVHKHAKFARVQAHAFRKDNAIPAMGPRALSRFRKRLSSSARAAPITSRNSNGRSASGLSTLFPNGNAAPRDFKPKPLHRSNFGTTSDQIPQQQGMPDITAQLKRQRAPWKTTIQIQSSPKRFSRARLSARC